MLWRAASSLSRFSIRGSYLVGPELRTDSQNHDFTVDDIEQQNVSGRITGLSEKCSGEVIRLSHLSEIPTMVCHEHSKQPKG
jgi:hypothetical protein